MLIDFFFHLKEHRIPVTTTEYLSLLEALSAGLANFSLDDFYALSRICLVKNEAHYDRFDLAFSDYFKNICVQSGLDVHEIPEDWLNAAASQLLYDEDYAMQERPSPEETYQDTQQDHVLEEKYAGNGEKQKFVGSNSSFGDGMFEPHSIRLDDASAGNRRAIKAWDSRDFKGLDDEIELNTRSIKMALRRLRKFAREGAEDELDLEATISSTARNAGWLNIMMRPERRNKVKVLILFDTGGSMDSHVKQCEELFSAVRSEFKQLEYFYFHNCIGDSVWRYEGGRLQSHYPVHYLLHKYGKDYKLIFVGDASMSPVELTTAGDINRNVTQESGEVWMRRLLGHYKHSVWLNPEPERYWHLTQTIQMLRDIMEQRMYPLTLAGLDQAMKALSK